MERGTRPPRPAPHALRSWPPRSRDHALVRGRTLGQTLGVGRTVARGHCGTLSPCAPPPLPRILSSAQDQTEFLHRWLRPKTFSHRLFRGLWHDTQFRPQVRPPCPRALPAHAITNTVLAGGPTARVPRAAAHAGPRCLSCRLARRLAWTTQATTTTSRLCPWCWTVCSPQQIARSATTTKQLPSHTPYEKAESLHAAHRAVRRVIQPCVRTACYGINCRSLLAAAFHTAQHQLRSSTAVSTGRRLYWYVQCTAWWGQSSQSEFGSGH